MTREQFLELLKQNRPVAVKCLMKAKVEEWMNDGPEEVARCLSCWAEQGYNLGNDEDLVELAEGCVFDDDD